MKKHDKGCECDQCFRDVVINSVDKWIEKTVKDNPGVVCPFCGTNPSKIAPHGGGFKDECGHEIRLEGLVVGWKLTAGSEISECKNPDKTRELIYINGKWVEQEVK